MPTPRVKLIPVVLDKARNIRLDFNALAEAEELTGKNFLDDEVWKSLSAKDLRAITYACLKHEDSKLTIEDVGAMLDPAGMGELLLILSGAFEEAMPKVETGEGDIPLPVTPELQPS